MTGDPADVETPSLETWLEGSIPLPNADEGSDAASGEYLLDADGLVAVVATALRELHATALDGCPTTCTLDDLLAEAERRVTAGVVQAERFDRAYRAIAPERLLELAHQSRPEVAVERVLVHGDARLTTLRLDGGSVLGWTGLHRAGAGDRYRDLATVAADLAERVSPFAVGPFFDSYGIDAPDVMRVDFHLIVDQLLR